MIRLEIIRKVMYFLKSLEILEKYLKKYLKKYLIDLKNRSAYFKIKNNIYSIYKLNIELQN